jgi:hypothetical protein
MHVAAWAVCVTLLRQGIRITGGSTTAKSISVRVWPRTLKRFDFPHSLGGKLLLRDAVRITTEKMTSLRPAGGLYPIRLQVELRVGGAKGSLSLGSTWTISISSRLILIEPDPRIRLGQRVHAVIDWPARFDDRIPLRLHFTGRTVPSDEPCLAIEVKTYEFRLAASRSPMAAMAASGSPRIACTAKIGA